MKVLVVVDMQKDFVDGALGTKEAQDIVPKVVEKIRNFDGEVYYTRDTHEKNYLDTQEGKLLPVPHCILGTEGWELVPEIRKLAGDHIYNKPTFGSVELCYGLKEAMLDEEVEADGNLIESITLVGLCTDICVISNAMLLKAFFPEVPVIVDASCCAGVTPESHENALEAMKMCQIQVENP